MSAMVVSDYQERREIPAEWEALLASVSPPSKMVPWLKLAWMPGIFYEPVCRWVLFECVPNLGIVDPFRLAALRGADPRTLGEWTFDVDPETLEADPKRKRWVSHSLVSRLQWELFHQTGCAPFLFWIIEGQNGGHRWRLPAIEKHFVTTLYGDGADVPNPGDRPYADFNQRTIDQIVRHDKLRRWDQEKRQPFGSLRKNDAGLYVAAQVWDQEKVYAATMLKYLTDQIEDGVSNLSDADIQRIMDRRKAGNDLAGTDIEAVEQRLVEGTSHALPEE